MVGTLNYMAPEALSLFADKEAKKNANFKQAPLSPMLDWFSLGVLLHEVLIGKCPFLPQPGVTYAKVCQLYPTELKAANFDPVKAHSAFMGTLQLTEREVSLLGPRAQSLVSGLLEKLPSARLGATGTPIDKSIDSLQAHPFFEGIDWSLAEAAKLDPPSVPVMPYVCNKGEAVSCRRILEASNRSAWVDELVSHESETGSSRQGQGQGQDRSHGGTALPSPSIARASFRGALPDSGPSATALAIPMDAQKFFQDWTYAHPDVIAMEVKCSRDTQRWYSKLFK